MIQPAAGLQRSQPPAIQTTAVGMPAYGRADGSQGRTADS
jgi:hypothetical protein